MDKDNLIELINKTELSDKQLETLVNLLKQIKKINLNWIVLLYDSSKNRIVFIDQNNFNISIYDLENQKELSDLIQDLTLTGEDKNWEEYNVLKTSGSNLSIDIKEIDKLIARVLYTYQLTNTSAEYTYRKEDMIKDISNLIAEYNIEINKNKKKKKKFSIL